MIRLWLITTLLPIVGQAQLVLSVVDGTNETPLAANSVYQLRAMESGDTQSIRLRVRNAGTQPAEITRFFADGTGFSLNRPLPPQTLAAGGLLNATLTFDAVMPANYSANLQLNGLSVLVLASVTAGPVLTIPANCMGVAANSIDFGIVTRGQPRTCSLTLSNPTTQAMTIATITVSGAGFSSSGITAPLALAAGQSASFALQVASQTVGVVTGTLRIQARDYALRATSVNAPLPTPIFEFESSAPASGQQRKLTLRLPSPSTITASGQVNLAFTANSILAADDPAAMFVETSSRQIEFAVEEGKTTVTLNGQAAATFQTGTTAGRIRFTLSGIASGFASEPEATMILAPIPIVIDKALPTRFADRVEVVFIGFDNTFSVGPMVFRFFDSAGQLVTAGIPVDFTTAFRDFYTRTPGGSTFQFAVKFPVSGNSFAIASVEVDLSNSAGTVRTSRLAF
ncbi:MAG: choice-of-anchor D domain-containing protein [Bryobacteraceae bacterium]